MLSKSILAVAFAGAATAVTPSGFKPVSTSDLVVAFGNKLALNGKAMSKADTAQEPIIGTTQRLNGTYTIMMVDPDIPPQTPGGPTGELLHWMQSGLTSAPTATMVGGMMVFVLSNSKNETAFAPYFGPSPPNKAPNTHRYTQILIDTSGSAGSSALAVLQNAAGTRLPFDAVDVITKSGASILAGNSFDVTNGTATATPTNGTGNAPAPVVSTPPINSATLLPSNITKTNPNLQQPGGAAASGVNPSPNSNGTAGTATNETAGPAASGTGAAPAPANTNTSGFGQRGSGAYVAGLLALSAALFLL